MKKQDSFYAQLRIGFYENRFQNQTILQLVYEFNRLANSRGWTAERSYFSIALVNEMMRRDVDVSSVVKWDDGRRQALSVRYIPVRYDEASKSMIPMS